MSREASHSRSAAESRDWVILTFLSIVWGSSFILIKKGIAVFEPDQMASLRIAISALALIPVFLTRQSRGIPRNKWFWIALVGIFGSGLPALLFAIAEQSVPSSVAGILNSLTPIFTWTLGLLFFSVLFVRRQLVGVVIGFLGAVIVIALQPNFTLSIDLYTGFIVIGTISYGLSGNIVKTHLQDVHPIVLNSLAFFIIGVPALVYAYTSGAFSHFNETPGAWTALLAIAVLAIAGTVTANILYFWLIQRTNAVFASSVAYLIPLMAVVWGVVDGEHLYWPQFAGMGLILIGVYVLRRS